MGRQLRVYVAGSSDPQERGRVKAAITQVKAHPHMQLTYDWVASKEEYANITDAELPAEERRELARLCAVGALAADVFWLLAPDFPTRGAWFEAGMVDGWNFLHGVGSSPPNDSFHRHIDTIASGPTQQSIFCSRMVEYATDKDAFFALCSFADRFVASSR